MRLMHNTKMKTRYFREPANPDLEEPLDLTGDGVQIDVIETGTLKISSSCLRLLPWAVQAWFASHQPEGTGNPLPRSPEYHGWGW